jgi:hypothetical protein
MRRSLKFVHGNWTNYACYFIICEDSEHQGCDNYLLNECGAMRVAAAHARTHTHNLHVVRNALVIVVMYLKVPKVYK